MGIRKLFTVALLLVGLVAVLAAPAPAAVPTLDDFSALPPTVGNAIAPNVLVIFDNSGSMGYCGYPDATGVPCPENVTGASPFDASTSFVNTKVYRGYFEVLKCYTYTSPKFSPAATKATLTSACATTQWDGNFLNWVTMRRIDLAKQVMTGGKCNTVRASAGVCTVLRGESSFPLGINRYFKRFNLNGLVPSTVATNTRCIRVESGAFAVLTNNVCATSGGTSFTITADQSANVTGVFQDVGDRARFGLMEYDTTNILNPRGGKVISNVGSGILGMVNAIESTIPSTFTPLAESLYEATRYFAQLAPAYNATDYTVADAANPDRDPYYYSSTWMNPAGTVGCCDNFVIVFTDGLPSQDAEIPAALQGYNASMFAAPANCAPPAGCTTTHTDASHNHATVSNHFDNCSIYYGPESVETCQYAGSHYLDDVALWAHTTDLRQATVPVLNVAGKPIAGDQKLTIYTFFAFGTSGNILKDTAKAGGFTDLNGDGRPGPSSLEWDSRNNATGASTPDGIPDTYFESSDVDELQTRLIDAITDILKRTSSGTSVAVLATSAAGDGAVYQSYFYPAINETAVAEDIAWLGFLQGLFLDSSGRLREDTNSDGRLVLSEDKIVETFLDSSDNQTKIRRYDVDANGEKTGTPTVIGLREVKAIWEAGKLLAQRDLSANPRTIKTWVDTNNNGVVNSGEFIDFNVANEATLEPYLWVADATEGTNVVNFIRGSAVTGMRSRDITVDGVKRTWRLGDIINSSPVAVGPPAERFDLKNHDASYAAFFAKYAQRREVLYVGANDGMLHAFNSGFFHKGDDPSTTTKIEKVWFSTSGPTGTEAVRPLGEELWAFIPQELLPHLEWITETAYTKNKHIAMVDGPPRITDAKVFTEEAACTTSLTASGCVHPGGWGTILIGTMRLGGGLLPVDMNFNGLTTDAGEDRFRSAYFALDITNPESTPTLLWVYKEKDLGFTMSVPAVMRFGTNTWYAAFGSGPITYKGERDNTLATNRFYAVGSVAAASNLGQIYVVNLGTGALVKKISLTDSNAFMGDPAVFDLPLDYVSDVMYIGQTQKSGSNWVGKLLRLRLTDSTFASYDLKTVYDAQKPVLVKPTATLDRSGRLWLYFGTGRLFTAGTSSDTSDTTDQALYGLKENGANGCWNGAAWLASCPATAIPSSSLLDVTSVSVADGGAVTCTSCGATTLSGLVSNVINSTSAPKQGWFLTLTSGERALQESTVIGGIVMLTTYKPTTDVCEPGGASTLYAMYYESGTAYSASVVGLNGTTVKRTLDLGKGVGSKVNVVVSNGTVTGLVQSSTGEIVQVQGIQLATNIRAGVRAWRERTD